MLKRQSEVKLRKVKAFGVYAHETAKFRRCGKNFGDGASEEGKEQVGRVAQIHFRDLGNDAARVGAGQKLAVLGGDRKSGDGKDDGQNDPFWCSGFARPVHSVNRKV